MELFTVLAVLAFGYVLGKIVEYQPPTRASRRLEVEEQIRLLESKNHLLAHHIATTTNDANL